MEDNEVKDLIKENDDNTRDIDFKTKGLSFDVTKVISVLVFLAVLGILITFSLIKVGFNWEEAFSGEWWTNFAILVALVIFGMIYGYYEGAAFLKNYKFGAFQGSRDDFLESVDKINKKKIRGLYPDWLQYYNKNKRKRAYEDMMYRYQIKKEYFGVLYIPQEKFDNIKTLIDKGLLGIVEHNNTYYKLSEKQWELCNAIRNGEIKIPTIDNDCYFLTENHNAIMDNDKLVIKASKQKVKNKTLIFTLRLVMLLAICALMAGFFVDKNGNITEQAVFDLLSRILTLLSGVSTGVSTAKRNNKIDVFIFRHKTDRNNAFIEDIEEKRYIPVNEQAKAKAEYESQNLPAEEPNLVENV